MYSLTPLLIFFSFIAYWKLKYCFNTNWRAIPADRRPKDYTLFYFRQIYVRLPIGRIPAIMFLGKRNSKWCISIDSSIDLPDLQKNTGNYVFHASFFDSGLLFGKEIPIQGMSIIYGDTLEEVFIEATVAFSTVPQLRDIQLLTY